jgi:ketosteroid isomerase-like protein
VRVLLEAAGQLACPLQRRVEIVDAEEEEKAVARRRVLGTPQRGMAARAPLVQAEQDRSIRVGDLLADDATWTIVGNSAASKTYPTKEAFLGEVIRPFNARMTVGLEPKIRSLYADGDTVIAFFDASGTAKDGLPYANTYAWFLELRDGKIVRPHAFYDSVAFNELWSRVQP